MNEAQSNANRSESIGKLAAALSKFQAEVENPTKESQGHKYKYADLANILNAIKIPLGNNKLSVCQMLGSSAQGISVTTILMHESGEYIESMLSLPQEISSNMSAPQQAGTTITYARRYALAACLGIAQQDDDAPKQTASHQQEAKPKPVNKSPSPTKAVADSKPSKTSVCDVASCETLTELDISFTVAGSVTVNVIEVLVLEPSNTLVPSIASIVFDDSDMDFFNSAIAETETSFFSILSFIFFS